MRTNDTNRINTNILIIRIYLPTAGKQINANGYECYSKLFSRVGEDVSK